ncbi:MAG: YeiH family putative sulfate export transporter [Sandaracinaceae bacterium]|nr:YeiH family putative sulfate export transporter [Sandaracinaceae bacterium]
MVEAKKNSVIPGLALTLVLACVAYAAQSIPFPPFTLANGRHPLDAMIVAMVGGLLIRNLLPMPAAAREGIKYSVLKILPFGIVLMGAKLNFYDVVRVSQQGLFINIACVAIALSVTLWICSRLKVNRVLSLLLAVGTAICGGTAIAVTAPVIEADEANTAFSVAAITLLGLLWVFVFPIVGSAIGLSQHEFGVWVGTAVHSTPQVVAAGFAYGQQAGDVAVIVKLVRVLLLAPLVVGIGAVAAREKRRRQEVHVKKSMKWTDILPPFVVGFVAMALFNTFNFLPDATFHLKDSPLWAASDVRVSTATMATASSNFLTTMAMGGVGLGVHLKELLKVGMKAFYVALLAAVILACVSLAMIFMFR